MSLRSEREKAVLEAKFARDRLNGFAAEIEHQVPFVSYFYLIFKLCSSHSSNSLFLTV